MLFKPWTDIVFDVMAYLIELNLLCILAYVNLPFHNLDMNAVFQPRIY
jgi:hypothetical protein